MRLTPRVFGTVCVFLLACADDAGPAGAEQDGDDATGDESGEDAAVRYRADVPPIKSPDDAKKGVAIPPFEDCRDPIDGEPAGEGKDGKVCTPVSIAGCTELGRYYPDYASCDVVRTQRPYWASPPAGTSSNDDPRLADEAFMNELSWVTEQLEASACTCCHDSREVPAAQWDIAAMPIWTDTVSDTGIALFTGLADSRSLGAYDREDNNGFDRTATGVPATDSDRMRAFFVAELARRGMSEEQAKDVEPFGGPIYRSLTLKAPPCEKGEGVDPKGRVSWGEGGTARYLYVLEAGSDNPGVPPNLDLPKGTVWRLDALASAAPLKSGLRYGETEDGSVQAYPASKRAPALEDGKKYQLSALLDLGFATTQCVFTYRAK
jgi:hypothetical protein